MQFPAAGLLKVSPLVVFQDGPQALSRPDCAQVVVAEMASESQREVVVYRIRVANAGHEWTVSRRSVSRTQGPFYV